MLRGSEGFEVERSIPCARVEATRHLIAYYNPLMAEKRKAEREELLEATGEALQEVVEEVRRGKEIIKEDEIGLKVGTVIERCKMWKNFELVIEDGRFSYRRKEESMKREKELDGVK